MNDSTSFVEEVLDSTHTEVRNLFEQVIGQYTKRTPVQSDAYLRGNLAKLLTKEEVLFDNVRPNIVQAIRAFNVADLAGEAKRLNQHFLYANCSKAKTKAKILESIAVSFFFPKQFGRTFDTLYDCLTDVIYKAGRQPGFVIVLESIPETSRFDKDARETLLDVFRDAAEFWADRKVNFRVFFSFT